jgi:hypothetical protein
MSVILTFADPLLKSAYQASILHNLPRIILLTPAIDLVHLVFIIFSGGSRTLNAHRN